MIVPSQDRHSALQVAVTGCLVVGCLASYQFLASSLSVITMIRSQGSRCREALLVYCHSQLSPHSLLSSFSLSLDTRSGVTLNKVTHVVSVPGLPFCPSAQLPLATLHPTLVLLLSVHTKSPEASAQCLGTQQALIKYLLSAYQVPSTDLGAGDTGR